MERTAGPSISLSLKPDESIKVLSNEGEKLLEIYQDEFVPAVKLLHENTNIDLPGKQRVRAKDIELKATEWQAKINATENVVVNGEMIKLNS